MRNYIILNGKNSNTIQGLLIQSLAPITKPMIRTQVEEIDGRDGDIVTPLGYSSYDKTITIGLYGTYDVNEVIEYFNSNGTVIFSDEPDKYYNYQIDAQIDFERLIRFKTATVTMHCQPFKYSTTEGADILSTNSNFATLNQSLNTDSGFYTYSSNVQDDITATRSGGSGGKFFAVFSVPVVQGVTYYFSGNGSKNISMYGYTNQLRGTSAGISGKGFNGYFTYTATFTGTMVLGFYSNISTEIFIRNFKISNQSAATVSGEGTNIVLENSAEAPFSRFDLKGNTEQTTISGKNLINIDTLVYGYINGNDGSITNNHDNGEMVSEFIKVKPSTTYTFSIKATSSTYQKWVGVGEYTTNDWHDFIRRDTSWDDSFTYTFTTADNAQYVRVSARNLAGATKIQLEEGSTATDYEQYVGGVPSPNPAYPQDVQVVTRNNVVDINGKNLLKLVERGSTSSGITATITNGVISFSGTATSTWSNLSAYANIEVPVGTYTFSITERLPFGAYVRLSWEDGSYLDYGIPAGASYKTFTTTKKAIGFYVFISGFASGTVMNGTISPQLEKSSIATTFEPYKGQNYIVNLAKNMLDINTLSNGYVTNSGTIQVTEENGCMYSDFIKVKPSTTYTFSIKETASTYPAWFGVGGYKTNSESGFVIRAVNTDTTATSITFTTAANVNYVRLSARNLIAATKVQFELGSEVTNYEPYNPIELCKIGNYQDYLYKSGDKWYKHKEINKSLVDFNNSSNYNEHSGRHITLNYSVDGAKRASSENEIITKSNRFVGASMAQTWNGTVLNSVSMASNGDYLQFALPISAGASWADVVAYLANYPTTVYHPLDTAVDEEITSETLIAQLEAISQANAYRGLTHINASTVTGDVPHIIAAEVATDPSGTITNSGNIYSKPKLTIFGSGSVGVYLNGVQMFQIALGTNDYITIDTAIMEAYQDNLQTLKNRSVTGDYNNFKLPVGESEISFSGNVTMCVVENYSRWL